MKTFNENSEFICPKPINEAATMIFMHAGYYDIIVGDALVCDSEMVQ